MTGKVYWNQYTLQTVNLRPSQIKMNVILQSHISSETMAYLLVEYFASWCPVVLALNVKASHKSRHFHTYFMQIGQFLQIMLFSNLEVHYLL